MPPDLREPGTHWCCDCRAYTRWKPVGRGPRERCEQCKTTFPCTHDCRHSDCRETKGQLPFKIARSTP